MKKVATFEEYINDDERVTQEEREEINFEVDIIKKMVDAKEDLLSPFR